MSARPRSTIPGIDEEGCHTIDDLISFGGEFDAHDTETQEEIDPGVQARKKPSKCQKPRFRSQFVRVAERGATIKTPK